MTAAWPASEAELDPATLAEIEARAAEFIAAGPAWEQLSDQQRRTLQARFGQAGQHREKAA